jgi:alkylation response protein AidB-like acyl-CoA dehydrogenase
MKTATPSTIGKPTKIRVALESTGLEPPLSELESAVQANVRRFALNVMRPAGDAMDRMAPEQTIAPDSPLWKVLAGVAELGISVQTLMEMPGQERARLMQIVYEELGWGDGGLTVTLGASMTPWTVMHAAGRQDLIEKYPEGSAIGCWAVTEPDRGSDMVDFYDVYKLAYPGSPPGKPNCIARVEGDEIVINGQKAAWVSNGPIAGLCVLYCAFDDGSGERHSSVLLVPLDRPGVGRGKVLEKLGQRGIAQGELFFNNVRIPRDHVLGGPGDDYERLGYTVLCDANAIMGCLWVGVARAAYEHALAYAHERIQGGVPIIQHQSVRLRLFNMFRRIEAARALALRVLTYNQTAPVGALQGSIAAKVTSTQTAFDVASDAIQLFGANGLTREYPVEKLMRDARSSMIEDGCNEVLSIKGGSLLIDPDKLRKAQ